VLTYSKLELNCSYFNYNIVFYVLTVATMLDVSPEEFSSALVAEYTTTRGKYMYYLLWVDFSY